MDLEASYGAGLEGFRRVPAISVDAVWSKVATQSCKICPSAQQVHNYAMSGFYSENGKSHNAPAYKIVFKGVTYGPYRTGLWFKKGAGSNYNAIPVSSGSDTSHNFWSINVTGAATDAIRTGGAYFFIPFYGDFFYSGVRENMQHVGEETWLWTSTGFYHEYSNFATVFQNYKAYQVNITMDEVYLSPGWAPNTPMIVRAWE